MRKLTFLPLLISISNAQVLDSFSSINGIENGPIVSDGGCVTLSAAYENGTNGIDAQYGSNPKIDGQFGFNGGSGGVLDEVGEFHSFTFTFTEMVTSTGVFSLGSGWEGSDFCISLNNGATVNTSGISNSSASWTIVGDNTSNVLFDNQSSGSSGFVGDFSVNGTFTEITFTQKYNADRPGSYDNAATLQLSGKYEVFKVPEPSSTLLLCLGSFSLISRRNRSKK